MNRACALVLFAAACGGSDDRVGAFIGTWTYSSGSVSGLDCDNDALDNMEMQSGNFTVAAGASSDLIIQPDPDSKCPPVKLDVSGSTAAIQPGQTCMYTEMLTGGAELDVAITYTKSDADIDAAGTALNFDFAFAINFTGAATASCTASATGSATKASARVMTPSAPLDFALDLLAL